MKRNSRNGMFSWDPFREITQLQKQINQTFDSYFPSSRVNDHALMPGTAFVPRTDVYEDQHGLKLRMEIPGIQPKDADITLDDGVLTVKGERKLLEGEAARCYLATESLYGPFFRSFALPNWVDPATLTANYVDGVLEIAMGKRAEARPKQIPINGEIKALGNGGATASETA